MWQHQRQSTEKCKTSQQKKRRWLQKMICLTAAVAICSTYAFIPPAHARELQCGLLEHAHSDACYTQVTSKNVPVCSKEKLDVHKHSSDCYDASGDLICGYADFVVHHHDDACYDEDGALWCTLPQISVHQHGESCYRLETVENTEDVGTTEEKEPALICEIPEVTYHQHDASCYRPKENAATDETEGDSSEEAEPELICEIPEVTYHQHDAGCYRSEADGAADGNQAVPSVKTITVLICEKPEITLHQHTKECFDENGKWICGKLQIIAHQHTADCFQETEVPADEMLLTCGMEEHTHTEACFLPEDEAEEPSEGLDALEDEAGGTLKISLLYGDGTEQENHPDGVSYYTHSAMSGYIRLEPDNLENDLTDVTVTLSLPKQYVEKDSINIPPFSTNSEITQYEILPIAEDEEHYSISIHFLAYDKTQTLVLPFALSFQDDVVPDLYRLPVTASVSCNPEATAPNIYKPLYKEWAIEKFVNSNRMSAFGRDGAEVVVTPQEENGNPYLDDLTYVDFAFIVNQYTNSQCNLNDFRDASQVTLTDTLPVYTDRYGVSRIAVFDAEMNPGWTLSDDGKTVSKTYSGSHSSDVLQQIFDDALHLRFPDLQFEKDRDGNLIADLTNTVGMLAVPSHEVEGETRPAAEDSLLFRLTNDPSTKGSFSKAATKGDIYDVDVYKTNPYPWGLSLSNGGAQPLRHIVIQDRKIVENGEVTLEGLDEALKFVRLESASIGSVLPEGKTFADIVEKVVAYYTDGTVQELPVTQADNSGNIVVTFDEGKICDGYEIVFSEDYEMRFNEKVLFMAYTVYRDPQNTHIAEGGEKITYPNTARAVNTYQKDGQTVTVYLKAGHSYDMLPSTEKLSVQKLTLYNSSTEYNKVGERFLYQVTLRGSLLEAEIKEYKDLRIVDLLPDGIRYDSIYLSGGASGHPQLDGGNNYQPEIIENYHNSGRTAVIFHLNADNLRFSLQNSITSFTSLYFWVTIDESARPGTVRNYVYVVGDNLDEYQEEIGGTEDIYDLNNNGRTDDRIAWSYSDAVIIAAQSIYAEKFIAPAGSENWSKQGLSLKAGMDFDYLLKVSNETAADHTGLTLYDVLPQIGDQNLFASTARGSEFPVRLRQAITPPQGYKVFYTTSLEVYEKPMDELIDNTALWAEKVSNYEEVTAFKLVAAENTILAGQSSFQVRIPVRVPASFSEASLRLLDGKADLDQTTGTAVYLEAINSFGFKTDQSPSEKESNNVWARVPFAGFCVKKTDGLTGMGLAGAEFTLKDAADEVIGTAVSDSQGFLRFRNLTEGAYTLTETKVPEGYREQQLSVAVTITQNPVTMEYTIAFDGAHKGSGTSADPLCIANYCGYELPETGGSGVAVVYALGISLMLLAMALLVRKKHIA